MGGEGGLGMIIKSNLNRVRLSCCWVGVGLVLGWVVTIDFWLIIQPNKNILLLNIIFQKECGICSFSRPISSLCC